MSALSLTKERLGKHRLEVKSGDFEAFKELTMRETQIEDWPFADEVKKNIPIYSSSSFEKIASDREERNLLLAELVDAFLNGPGVIAIKQAISEHDIIDDSNANI